MTKKVAIIGFSFKFPGTTRDNYWQNLLNGVDLVTEVPDNRWSKDTFLHPDKNHQGTSYTFAAGSIGDISTFDASFFGISPREAALIDPQQRLLLEMSWEALENAGIKPSSLRGSSCGVFVGMSSADYAYQTADDFASIDSFSATGNTASIAANRISYNFDLRGPSMVIDTACSSSMVAFHQACRAILAGDITQALVGGISLHLHPYGFIIFSKASMLSPRGRCNPFDASADGYVRSEGGGMFFIKDYDQAIKDGDPIIAVVANSGINTDGKKSGLTFPSATTQASLLKHVYKQANIDPATIDYFEAHGTGTAVGDPVESLAIGEALAQARPTDQPLLIGSVKSNMGHLEAASGIAGLVKALHCIQYRIVPATIGVRCLNPNIDFEALNLKVAIKNHPLKTTGKVTIGINSFGFGGANAHVILESHEATPEPTQKRSIRLSLPLVISAKSATALKETATEFADFLTTQPESALYPISYQSLFRRDWHEHRAIVHGDNLASISQALLDFSKGKPDPEHLNTALALSSACGPAFIFSGNGSQWFGMGKTLLEEEPVFKKAIKAIDVYFLPLAGFSLQEELKGNNGADRYQWTEIAQPALFAIQVGITQVLAHYGVLPIAVMGHSVGEVAAAWASGALTLKTATTIIYHRSKLQGLTKGQGEMSAVGLSHDHAQRLIQELNLESSVYIAGINSSRAVTVAGNLQALAQLEAQLHIQGVFFKRLDLDYAFHTPFMDSIEQPLKKALEKITLKKTHIPFYSSVTGCQLLGTQLNATYWWDNIRKPVLFEQAVKALLNNQLNLLIEIGPHTVLRSYLNDSIKDQQLEARILSTLTRHNDTPKQLLKTVNQSILAGATIQWSNTFKKPSQTLQLPNYPWQRESYWHPVTPESTGLLYRYATHSFLGYPLQHQALTWENQLDTKLNPTLADHVVGGATVFPGAGFIELTLAATTAWQSIDIIEIEDLEIQSPLLLSADRAKLIHTQIDPKDGRITIKSRDYNSRDAWTSHGVARILSGGSHQLLTQSTPPTLPNRQPDFNGSSHKLLTDANGLSYGPAFQCIDYGWLEGNTALGVFKIPETIQDDLDKTYLHPALLDCTFQLIFQLLKEYVRTTEGMTFVPTKMGRTTFKSTQAKPHFASATLLRQTPRSLTAEFSVFDQQGLVIAILKEVRFSSIRLSKNASDPLSYLNYYYSPRPHRAAGHEQNSVISFESTQSAIGKLTRRAALKGSHRRYSEEVEPLLDSLCSLFTEEIIQQFSVNQRHLYLADILAQQTEKTINLAYINQLLSLAETDQLLAPTIDGWNILTAHESLISALDVWNSLIADYPDYFHIIHAVGQIGLHLKDIITGATSLNRVRPQESSLSTLMSQVLGAEGRRKVGLMLRNLITDGIHNLPQGQRLKIVEISEGFPAFAMDICNSLNFICCDYLFASTSAETLENLSLIKEQFPNIQTQTIDKDSAQSVMDSSYSIALFTFDFDDFEKSKTALDFAYTCLAPGGVLIIIGQHPTRWIDFVFGGQFHHWSRQEETQAISNQRTTQFWHKQLQQANFSNISLHEVSPGTCSGPYILLAEREEHNHHPAQVIIEIPRSWIILADTTGYSAELSDRLTKELQTKGDLVIQSSLLEKNSLEALLFETTHNYGSLDGIILLTGLLPQSTTFNTDSSLAIQTNRCMLAANLLQAAESALSNETTFWIITTAATNDPEYVSKTLHNKRPLSITPSDSVLWGFGRSLNNETTRLNVRLLDFSPSLTLHEIVNALITEIDIPDDEEEIFINHQGARFASRLQFKAPPNFETTHCIENNTIKLGFQFPGQLRNLRWEVHPRSLPNHDEIEIEVHASGLNFRDVMFALGLLSDEAIENGFSGPSLGLEFSGVISRVGDSIQHFSIGDRVVGFGPSSFSNRVLTKENALSQIPPSISFEAAATIPSTFFTVYYSLHHLARLQPGEKILIHGAAGGIGLAAIQIAKWMGAEIYATAGSNEKRDFLHLLGIENIYDSRSLNFADEILADTQGAGIDIVLNSLAGEAINRNFQVLKPFGRFLELGKRDFYENTQIGLRPFRNNISYFGIDADQLLQLHSALTQRLFTDMMALFAEGILQPLPYHSFEADDIVSAFRYMQQARQIGKIIITYHNGINKTHPLTPGIRTPLTLSYNASYLITGGLSGLGLKTAEWLVKKGARHLILLSRSGPNSEEAKLAIEKMTAQGINVCAVSCDITDKNALSTLLRQTSKNMPPLKGIIHAAAVINDGMIKNMTTAQLTAVLTPKILGAYYLHELTIDLKLDMFVLFSSATTLFGNPGQANYVAANTSLEALAQQRRANGLTAICVAWGAIDDVGYLARNEKIKESLQHRMGGAALHSSNALDILEKMLLLDQTYLGVMEFNWSALSRFLRHTHNPKFNEVAKQNLELEGHNDRPEDIRQLLLELSSEELLTTLIDRLKHEVGEIIRIAPDKIEATQSIYDMGLDSLMGIELIVALESRFGIRLPVMALSENPTIAKLAERLAQQLLDMTNTESTQADTILTQTQQLMLQHGVEESKELLANSLDYDLLQNNNSVERIIH